MTGQDVTGLEEYAEKAARDAGTEGAFAALSPHLGVGRTGGGTWGCACGRVLANMRGHADLRHGRHLARVVADLLAEARVEERERIAAAIEACICNYGPNTEGPERECFRHGEEAAEFYLGHAARIARGEAT